MADCWRCIKSSSGSLLLTAWRPASMIHVIPIGVIHGLDEIIFTRMLMIAMGYEDGNDADRLRRDPMFKLAMSRLLGDGDLCPQTTI
jgi:hypothetical protein